MKPLTSPEECNNNLIDVWGAVHRKKKPNASCKRRTRPRRTSSRRGNNFSINKTWTERGAKGRDAAKNNEDNGPDGRLSVYLESTGWKTWLGIVCFVQMVRFQLDENIITQLTLAQMTKDYSSEGNSKNDDASTMSMEPIRSARNHLKVQHCIQVWSLTYVGGWWCPSYFWVLSGSGLAALSLAKGAHNGLRIVIIMLSQFGLVIPVLMRNWT
jgi:hypothetical protein